MDLAAVLASADLSSEHGGLARLRQGEMTMTCFTPGFTFLDRLFESAGSIWVDLKENIKGMLFDRK